MADKTVICRTVYEWLKYFYYIIAHSVECNLHGITENAIDEENQAPVGTMQLALLAQFGHRWLFVLCGCGNASEGLFLADIDLLQPKDCKWFRNAFVHRNLVKLFQALPLHPYLLKLRFLSYKNMGRWR